MRYLWKCKQCGHVRPAGGNEKCPKCSSTHVVAIKDKEEK
jgi:rubredoxin